MSLKNYSEIVTDTVNKLSVQDSYNGLCHQQKDDEPFPSSEILSEVVGITRSILFPGFFGKSIINTNTISYHLGVSIERLYELLYTQILAGMCFGDFCEQNDRCLNTMREEAKMKTERFIEFLPELRSLLALDVKAAFNNDPAAHSTAEVIFCYPGLRAICNYRIAHKLIELDVPLIPRMISEMAHSETDRKSVV